YGPEYWQNHYPKCGGRRQSPISINRKTTAKRIKWSKHLKLLNYHKRKMLHGDLINDGHSLGMKITNNNTDTKIIGGPLKDSSYSLQQFHFHFPCYKNESASEHRMLGMGYMGELHFVFANDKYSKFKSAVNKSDGLVVLGFLLEIGDERNIGIENINKYIHELRNPHSHVEVSDRINVNDLINTAWGDFMNYASYKGSLTTPPCFESVRWIVMQQTIKVRWSDVVPWTKLKGSNELHICKNNRPLQKLNHRNIKFGFNELKENLSKTPTN
ncbi:hypothetical protein MXB_3898, partial [Myxobolus squamalis]